MHQCLHGEEAENAQRGAISRRPEKFFLRKKHRCRRPLAVLPPLRRTVAFARARPSFFFSIIGAHTCVYQLVSTSFLPAAEGGGAMGLRAVCAAGGGAADAKEHTLVT